MTQDVSGTTNDLSRTFTYTLAGQLQTRVNATAAHAFSPAPGTSAYAANGRNQYTTVAGATHTHDLNGNLTGDGARSFGYDAENRLTSVSGSASMTLTYDPLGRLRQTTAGATTDFLYEGDRLIAEYNGSTLLRRYAHGPGIDEPIVWYEGATLTTKRWLHPDERGSIVAWTDGSAIATVYRYGAFGEPANNDFSGSRFRYTGQIALPEVKLYHYKARVYDPTLGRFLQTDPVGYDDDFNLYAYVYNDPLNRTDPNGTADCPLPCEPKGNPQRTRQGGVDTGHAKASENLMAEGQQAAVERGARIDSASYNQQASNATDGGVDSKKQPDTTINTTERDGTKQTEFGEVERDPAKNARTQAKLDQMATKVTDDRKLKTVVRNFVNGSGKLIPGVGSVIGAGSVVSSVISGDAEAAALAIIDTVPGGAFASAAGALPVPTNTASQPVFISPY